MYRISYKNLRIPLLLFQRSTVALKTRVLSGVQNIQFLLENFCAHFDSRWVESEIVEPEPIYIFFNHV
jgi:hypothetical protein